MLLKKLLEALGKQLFVKGFLVLMDNELRVEGLFFFFIFLFFQAFVKKNIPINIFSILCFTFTLRFS